MQKLEVLRSLETYGYRIAYYLLQDEEKSIAATAAALTELYDTESFFLSAASFRHKLMKRAVLRQSLELQRLNARAGLFDAPGLAGN